MRKTQDIAQVYRTRDGLFYWSQVEKTETCWNWTGSQRGHGYGVATYQGKRWGAHRLAWVLAGRALTPGLELDHLCRNKLCVNPDHLEEVTHQENTIRRSAVKVQCPHGHLYDESNTGHVNGQRYCKTCNRVRALEYKRRKRAETKVVSIVS